MLAIAAPSFAGVSQTFIRAHARWICPGDTVLICQDGQEAEQFGYPVLAQLDTLQLPVHRNDKIGRIRNSIRYRWRRYAGSGLSPSDSRRALEFLHMYQAKAVLAEYGPMGCQLRQLCRSAGIRLFVHFHGYDASWLLRDRRQVADYGRMFRSAAGVVVPTRFLERKLKEAGCPKDRLFVNPYGVDVSRFEMSCREPLRVVAVGRLVEKKAPDTTIRAFARVVRRFPAAQLDMIGDGPLFDRCKSMISKLGLKDRVKLHGNLDPKDVQPYLQRASIFVQHSVTASNGDAEGLPVAILEAMACGLPVVSTRHSGIPEAVSDGTTGLLVDEYDAEGMAEGIERLMENPDLGASMGTAGRARVLAHHTHEIATGRLRSIMGLEPAA